MSAILSAEDLNDFISPGVACIKPVETIHKTEIGYEIQIGVDGQPVEISIDNGQVHQLQKAQISLSDCLACSGCITSAEEVLVAQHSHKELVNALKNRQECTFVVSFSHQSRSSLAAAFGLTIPQTDYFLLELFTQRLGFAFAVGLGLGRKIALDQIANDMLDKKAQGISGPTLSSVCPGWVLYAEKTHPHVIPKINTTKSPQQITGRILKTLVANQLKVEAAKVYHLSIMPCFDKKLESARSENSDENGPDVDCVITPRELVQMMEEEGMNYIDMIESARNFQVDLGELYVRYAPKQWPLAVESWMNDEGSASGGYALNYLLALQAIHEEQGKAGLTVCRVEGRNPDIYELRLVDAEGQVLGTSGVINGFRNIQNLVRKLKPNGVKRVINTTKKRGGMTGGDTVDVSKCDFIEVMACPGGCINGGGQIKEPDGRTNKDWIKEVAGIYSTIPVNGVSSSSLHQWLDEFYAYFKVEPSRLLRMEFHEVEKPTDTTSIALGSKW
ncbi:unnamed protein product [Kuraishia capsulata CBS 1993]|uniref:Cytosolic Fe-S cluster assembly factor NAR1 n=1 Tax=Kuraishia capsulata CBS 1993 TaxID=1382522 RepID=W6MM41_9ASCO|nr:uncharacterized protein KUCA_T00001938001 [Kuraishia capsulata CBS 1993]CDK25967.1 unnamed protein product [Kuraishia capsulata CBS 1993]